MGRIHATTARYIKLGPSGGWENLCIEDGTLRLGHGQIPHDLALSRDKEAIRQRFIELGATPAKASDKAREVLNFYDGDEDTIWITFANGYLYWCRAAAEVEPIPPSETDLGSRLRRCRGGWSRLDAKERPLLISGLSGRLTRTAAYRQTICQVTELPYLLARLNGDVLPDVEAAQAACANLSAALQALIQRLTWQDFELFVDLIFSSSGWRRVGVLGGHQKTVDLELELPSTGERAFVQVKSDTDQAQLNDYLERFRAHPDDRMFYAYHSNKGSLVCTSDAVTLLGPKRLADMAINAGLTNWVIERMS